MSGDAGSSPAPVSINYKFMKKIKTFYTPKQVCHEMGSSFSKSPLKPYLLMKKINDEGYGEHFNIESKFIK